MTEPLLEAVNVTKDLGTGAAKVAALKGVSLALRGGELTLLMGPSGSGKTTLLSILGCMLTPTAGTVRIRQHSIGGADPEDLLPYCSGDQTPMDNNCRPMAHQEATHGGSGLSPNLPSGLDPANPAVVG